tara:strand:- start:1764 stop:2216 length:453 start_codon:yes stop_codon:yes gene_type:complete
MTTLKERKDLGKKTLEIISSAAGTDGFALDYLWMWARCSRCLDDIFDDDHPVSREELLEVFEYLLIKIPTNPFFTEYRETLLSQHVSMYNAWMAANEWDKGDKTDRIYAHVWRDTHHELVPIVALLTQGHEKMKEISDLIRKTFKKDLGD